MIVWEQLSSEGNIPSPSPWRVLGPHQSLSVRHSVACSTDGHVLVSPSYNLYLFLRAQSLGEGCILEAHHADCLQLHHTLSQGDKVKNRTKWLHMCVVEGGSLHNIACYTNTILYTQDLVPCTYLSLEGAIECSDDDSLASICHLFTKLNYVWKLKFTDTRDQLYRISVILLCIHLAIREKAMREDLSFLPTGDYWRVCVHILILYLQTVPHRSQ